ncbi:MAG: DUF302 domain-containing protein [Deltaproteobacteria bacterium]|nr:MAG: DUF302 domain-containing protein [Deltaproteobacteria bacterium]
MKNYGIRKTVQMSYEEALAKVPEALQKQGFGILTEIDVKETLKKKLDVDFRKYKILGACNPPLAHKALSTNLEIGLLLPCNVIVYEGDGGETVVSAIDPIEMIAGEGDPTLEEVARTAREKLMAALEIL